MKVSACLLASSALLIGVTAGSDRLRRTQQITHGSEWMTNGERDAGTTASRSGMLAKKPKATANSTMPGGMGNTTTPGIANSTMPGMANTTMPGTANHTSMANVTSSSSGTNVTRRAKTVGAANHSSTPVGSDARNATTTNSTAAAANTTTPGMANNSMPAGTGSLPTPTRAPHTTVGGRNVSGGTGFHRMLRAMDYAASLADATATNTTMPASVANSTLNSTMPGMANTTMPGMNSTMPGMDNTTMPGMANATTTTTNTTAAMPPPTATRFLMHMMENATMPLGGANSSLPMPNSTIPLRNTTVPGMANGTTNSTLVGVRTPTTTRLLSTHRMRARMGDNATMPGMMNSTMPMPSHNATTNSTMPAGMGNSTTMSNTTMMGVGH